MGARKASKKKSSAKAVKSAESMENAESTLPVVGQDEALLTEPTATDQELAKNSEESAGEPLTEPAMELPPETESKNDEVAHKHHYSSKQKLVFVGFGLVILLGLVLTRLYIAKTSLNKVTIAGVAAGRNISADKLEPQLKQKADRYQLKIGHPKAEVKSFSLKEAGLAIDTAATISQSRQRLQTIPFVRRLQFWRTQNLPVVLKIDETAFAAFLLGHANDVTKPAQNASLSIEAGNLKVTPAAAGEGYQVKDARQTILDGAALLQTSPFQMQASEIKPTLTDADLEPAKKKATSLLGRTVTLIVTNKTIQATPVDIGSWIELTPIENEKTIDVTVNSGKVIEYLTNITKPYITAQRAQVVSTQSDGSTVILVQGQNGVDVQKKDAVAADIAKKLLADEDVNISLPITTATFKTVTAQAYDKWIAVDTTAKRLYAYEKTNLVRTVLVSAGAPGTPTVLGQYAIYSKFAKQDMRGNNVDGSRYFQPNVQWVNYFYKDYAIHGNYWRPASYFGNINSSHGCVGIMNVDGEWVFNWAPIGTPVIVYN